MKDSERPILGKEALYSFREFFKASLGSEKMFSRISRASKLEVFFLLWLLQSSLIIIGNYLVSARIRYNYLNVPQWVTSADIWIVEDRAFNLAVIKSLLVVPGFLIAMILCRIFVMKVVGERLKGEAYLSSAITAFSATLVPECFRVIAMYATHLFRLPPEVIVNFDLSGAKSSRYLASLGVKVTQELYNIYEFRPWDVLVITSIFLAWETYLFYKIFRIIYGLEVNKAIIATFILSTITGWMNIYSSLIPWVPKYFVDPFEFRPPPPPVPVG